MAVVITETCVTCGACLWECPTEAIAPGAPRPIVAEARCTECYGYFGEAQCVVVCPVDAIVVAPEPIAGLARKFQFANPLGAKHDTWIWRRVGRLSERGSA